MYGFEIKESDWKIFRKLHGVALERFFDRTMAEIRKAAVDEGGESKEQYWKIHDLMERRRKDAVRLFDGMCRSTAMLQLVMICREDLLTAEEMSRFSQETREKTRGFLDFARR